MHLSCLPDKESYRPHEPYICPRHDQKGKHHAASHPSSQSASGYKPSAQFPRPVQGIPKPGFDPRAIPPNAGKRSTEEHIDRAEEIKANEEKKLQEKFYAESREIMEEMTGSLNRLVEQHGKAGKNEKFRTDEEKDWNILDGKDLYSLSQGNIKKRIKKFTKQFKSKAKVIFYISIEGRYMGIRRCYEL